MSQSFTIAVLSFTIVMFLFNIVKDVYIRYNKIHIPEELQSKMNKRWGVSLIIGIVILYLLYGGP